MPHRKDIILSQCVQRLAHFVVAGQGGDFLFFLTGIRRLVGPVAHHIEPHLQRQIQHLANPRKIQFVGLVAQGEKFPPLCMGQGMTAAAFLYANMVEFLQQRKIFKGPGCFGSARLGCALQCAGADHLFNHIAAIRAVAARSFVKRALARQNGQVFSLCFRGCPRCTVLALCSKKLCSLGCNLIPPDGGKIVFGFVALVGGKCRVTVHHFPHSSVMVVFHALRVGVNGLQQLSVFLGIVRLAVAAKSPTLHQVQQDSGKIHGGYRTVQSLCTQRVNIG